MKVTFVTEYFGVKGGFRVIALYADLLTRRGHEVMIVSQPARRPSIRQQARQFLSSARKGRPIVRSRYLDGLEASHRVLETRRPVTDADVPDADAVIATWWETAFWVAALSPSKGRKFYFVQGHEVHDHLPWRISRGSYYLPLKKIAVSQWLVDIMAQEYGDRDVALVCNAVDMRQFHAPERGRQPVPTVGLMYSTLPVKGVDVSLRAIELVKQRIPDLKVVAFGMQDPAAHLPLPEGCTYFKDPRQHAIRDIYAACDLWLSAGRAEGFGLPLLEAMACRTPVVATRSGAAADLVADGVNGFLVDPDDADALADRAVRLLALAPDAWRAMSDAAVAVAAGYTWDDAADFFENVLQT